MGRLAYNIGGTTFNTDLLVDVGDTIDLSFGTVYVTNPNTIFENEDFDLFINVNNDGLTAQNVFLFIYGDDINYYGTTATVSIAAGGNHLYTFNDCFTQSGYVRGIRIQAYVGTKNYATYTYNLTVYDATRILTTTEIRDLTDDNIRVTI
jgi:hypothetical protein